MGGTPAPLPTREQVRGWSPRQRATVAQLLQEHLAPPPGARRSPRRRALVLTVGAGGALSMLPWLVYLSATLPARSAGGVWRTAWVGFDVALTAAFAATALSVWYRRQLAAFAMAITATLLTCDAWFDVCLSWGTTEQWTSIIAAAVELPVATLLATSTTTLMRRSCTLIAQLRGQDPAPLPLWKQPMLHTQLAATRDPAHLPG